ncbi:MAG: hypothetical protein J6Z40_05430 [Oscillospiraceae bacterium]|nr:hypothetical protein [Oscillospiraceae bacterium]
MKNSTKILLVAMSLIEGVLAVVLFNALNTSVLVKIIIVAAVILLALIADAAIMHSVSASVVSDAKKLKDTDDYIRAFQAWLSEDTPFTEYIRLAINQLESLKRKQKALRVILDDSKDSPFLSTADEVDQYILANCKRILNRVMIYDKSDAHKYNMHVAYLQQVLGENAHVLSDFENLILEVSQIGDDANAATPCLNELTNALRSMRSGADSAWEAPAVPTDAGNEPPQQMMMQ